MTTVVLVHGTGTRQAQYDQNLAEVQRGLAERRPDIQVASCCWGVAVGAKLLAEGKSIPVYNPRSLEALSEEDYDVVLWSQLYQDPLFELRVLATSVGTTPAMDLQLAIAQQLDQRVRTLTPSPELTALLTAGGIETVFEGARQTVLASEAYREALGAVADDLAPSSAAVARAVVAQAMADADRQDLPAPILHDAALRDAIIDLLLAHLGAASRSLSDWVIKQLLGLVMNLGAFDQIERQRSAITSAVFPYAGDVLLYQARGQLIRDFIRTVVEHSTPPVVLLAHSLGSMVCVDLLVERHLPQVQLLVTVGSQVSFLYEINALASLSYGQPLPDHFPKWLNLYDLGDFLSYVGAEIFPGRVDDVAIDSRQPFPRSHGAYWVQPATWEAIIARLPAPLPSHEA